MILLMGNMMIINRFHNACVPRTWKSRGGSLMKHLSLKSDVGIWIPFLSMAPACIQTIGVSNEPPEHKA